VHTWPRSDVVGLTTRRKFPRVNFFVRCAT